MTQVRNDHNGNQQNIERIAHALQSGMVVVDSEGEVIGATPEARRVLVDQLEQLELPLDKDDQAVSCFISTLDVGSADKAQPLGIVQLSSPTEERSQRQRELHHLIGAAVTEIMAEPSWFVQALTEKLKAWCQSTEPRLRSSEIDMLTAREREILALVCEGRSDTEMGQMLRLSQNTVRNHVASLFRKIGVNRRSAAIIWARERGFTRYDAALPSRRVPQST